MIEGTEKMEKDEKEGRGYSLAICMQDNEEEDVQPRAKRARTQQQDRLTWISGEECKCGGKDHKRISSSKCPWKGQSQEVVTQNYERRLEKRNLSLRVSQTTTAPTGNPTGESEVEV
jgi:hypothetical protein